MTETPPPPGAAAWHDLVAERRPVHGGDGVPPHEPVAAILACADARVSPELVLGVDIGQLFVVRVAGASAVPAAVASLDYAVDVLGVPVVVVLGHTGCGAAGAAAAALGGDDVGDYRVLAEPFAETVADGAGLEPDELVRRHVAGTVEALLTHDGATGRAGRDGTIDVLGAVYDLGADEIVPIT